MWLCAANQAGYIEPYEAAKCFSYSS